MITVVIHTHNEEKNIKESILSAQILTNKIVVIDMESTDKTVELANKNGAQIMFFPYSSYVEPSREFGIKNTNTDWVFLLDADERITQKLATEIKTMIQTNDCSYFKVPRKNVFGNNKWLKYGGWWPDYQTRLINKKYFVSWPKEIHSTPVIRWKFCLLKNPLTHYFHGDLENMVKKTAVFENIESDLLFKANRQVSILIFFRKFMGELFRRMIKKLGFIDGPIGIIESIYQAFSKTITYLYLYEKKNRRSLQSLS